jgi:hypothetical protein
MIYDYFSEWKYSEDERIKAVPHEDDKIETLPHEDEELKRFHITN